MAIRLEINSMARGPQSKPFASGVEKAFKINKLKYGSRVWRMGHR
jgi:hypothetical protein